MKKYRKKPVVILAVQWVGRNINEISQFMGATHFSVTSSLGKMPILEIPTLEGTMTANCGDFIIRGVNGEFYPCKPDIFEKTYEPVGDF